MIRFKRFCSLGWNCEPGLYLRKAGYPNRRDFFKWSATPFEALYATVLNDFIDTYDKCNLEINGIMVVDTKYRAATHKPSKERLNQLEEAGDIEGLFAFIDEDKKQRGKDFLNELKAGEPIAYILTYKGSEARYDAERFRELLHIKGAHRDSLLILVQEADRFEQSWQDTPGVDNRYISSFAPYDAAEAFSFEGWSGVLSPYDVLETAIVDIDRSCMEE